MFKPRKVGWSDKGNMGCVRVGENCAKYLKTGATEGRGNKDFKKGEGASWVKEGALKRGGGWNPLTNYDVSSIYTCTLLYTNTHQFSKIKR